MFEGWAAAAAVTAGAGLIGGAISASGAESAAQTQANAANNAQQISQQEFNTITQQNAPFMQSGYGALSQLDYLLGIGPNPGATAAPGAPQAGVGAPQPSTTGAPGLDPSSGYQIGLGGTISRGLVGGAPAAAGSAPPGSLPGYPGPSSAPVTGSTAGGYGSLLQSFTADTFKQYSPAYQFQLQQGQQGVLNADAGSQGALSGATMKDLIGYNQNLANTSFNNAFNQYQTQQGNIFNRLSGIAQLGQASANNTGQQGTALAGQAAQSATNIGTALAAGQVGAANAISGGIQSAVPWLAYGGGQPANYGTISGGFGYNPSGNAAAIDPATGTDYSAWSDRRLKTDIEPIGEWRGLPFYRFRYTFAPDEICYGVMADEVRALFPQAVESFLGYDRVHYGRIPCRT